MKKILVTSDLSNNALSAIKFAKSISEAFNAKITILTVIENAVPAMALSDIPTITTPTLTEETITYAKNKLSEINEKYFNNKCETKVVTDVFDVGQAIVDYASSEEFDMIIISTHGRTGISRLLIGSVAEKVVRMSPIPVLTVRANQ